MNTIKTIDLWTEQNENHIECFSGAFVDGFENGNIPFDTYKVIRNGNCIITSNLNELNISNKHNAIVFYKNNIPVRLMVINQNTDIDNCINVALSQQFNDFALNEIYIKLAIKRYDIDLRHQPIHNNSNKENEIDVGSCDKPSLLNCMLDGCYTQSDTNYGKSNSDSNYSFIPDIFIQYDFTTDAEQFQIEHRCAFLNENMTRIIPLQEKSLLNIDEISNQFIQDNKEINMNGKIKVFINYFDFQFDSKKYTNEISKFVSNYINEEDTKDLINLYGKMTRIYKKALNDIDLPLYVENDISIDNINKLIKLGISPKEELLDNLMLLIDLEHTLKTNNFLVFVNLKQYLTKDEVVELYKYAIYNEITIMLVDSICHGVTLKNEKKYIIDENLDEFML